jgi:ribosomal-protein-alanine acetyltransferase
MHRINTTTLPFKHLNAMQWQSLAAIEQESHLIPWSMASLQACADERHTAVALLIEQQVAAYMILMHAADEWELLNLTVAAELRRLGLGQQLLALGLQQAKSAGTQSVLLEVRQSNLSAQTLYKRAGFIQVGQRKGYYQTEKTSVQEDALILKLSLAPGLSSVLSPSSTGVAALDPMV